MFLVRAILIRLLRELGVRLAGLVESLVSGVGRESIDGRSNTYFSFRDAFV